MAHSYTLSKHKKIAIFFLQITLLQISYPTITWALTSGPSQPEFSGFEPVGTTDLVNKFTGDFNYSLPLLEVPGPQGTSYPLTLAYHSGTNAEEEASWVGYGWNLGPGAITRNARGLPDDYCNEPITYYNQVPTNYTLTAGLNLGAEAFSSDRIPLSVSANLAVRYNNYAGFGYNQGLGVSLGRGIVSLGINESDSRHSYSASVNPAALLSALTFTKNQDKGDREKWHEYKGFSWEKSISRSLQPSQAIALFGGNRGSLDYNEGNRSTQVASYSGSAYNVTIGATFNPFAIPVGITTNLTGSYAEQRATPQEDFSTYGYLYSSGAVSQKRATTANGAIISDYYTEKDAPYNKRDVFLGVPFANADIYNVSGDGLGGSFQAHHAVTGEFSPNVKRNETKILNLGADLSAGWTFGGGLKGSAGYQALTESGWDEAQNRTKELKGFSSLKGGKGSYFRFTNDLGGTVGYDLGNDNPIAAGMRGGPNGNVVLDKAPLAVAAGQAGNTTGRAQQGAFIGHHTVAQASLDKVFRYCRRDDINAIRYKPVSNSTLFNSAYQDSAIAEFRIANEKGRQYTYGLPIYSRTEQTMQYGVRSTTNTSLPYVDHNFLVYTDHKDIMVGEQRKSAYATGYLLTEITTPDYIDRNLNGPDDKDFGGYTSFSYVKTYGAGIRRSNWYHWRTPYTGHNYEVNSLSDPDDDMATVAEGDKEISYLQAVRTKTHTAIFTIANRLDGLSASRNAAARTDSTVIGFEGLSKLTAINLYANKDVQQLADPVTRQLVWKANAGAIPIKTITFDYDYSLCPGTPNTDTSTGENAQGGKLTLLSVTTAYNGVVTANPYRFKYTYPDYTLYPAKYEATPSAGLGAAFSSGYKDLNENPVYDRYSLDAWGNYQAGGKLRYLRSQTWLNQGALDPGLKFDPAAWQLKVIQLPSGGEIHVQYEQDDYAYVQDKTVHALAALDESTYNSSPSQESFVIDPSTVGLGQEQDVAACKQLLDELYVARQKKIFFKFLYNLVGSDTPELTSCNADYVSGYVTLRSVAIEPDNKHLRLTIGSANQTDYSLPQQVCWDYTQTQRLGKLRDSQKNCGPAALRFDPNAGVTSKFRQFASWAQTVVLQGKSQLCRKLNPRFSYFKIPLPISKKGGGLRVKRLLTYDKGLDGIAVLYGSEFEYKAYDRLTKTWRSSGVATTEPAAMRVENALVEFIPRLQQGAFDKAIAGPDRKQAEGPVGESILPGAMVGYGRVTVKNIHSGKSNPGYSITEYFTSKDAPMQWRMSPLNSRTQYRPIYGGLVNLVDNNVWSTQGFSFILNNMNGQLKREATYAGPYDDINTQAKSTLISEQQYQYYNPDDDTDKVLVQAEPESDAQALDVNNRVYPGKEVDVTMAQRAVRDNTLDASLETDLQFTPFLFYVQVWLTANLSVSKFNSEFYSHTTSKVIRYPAIVKQISSFHDGVRDTIENKAFDKYTGSPVAVRSSDMDRGAYWKQSVMAPWVYSQLQGKVANEGVELSAPQTSNGSATALAQVVQEGIKLYLKPTSASNCPILSTIRKGDILAFGQESDPSYQTALYFAETPDIVNNRIQLYAYLLPGGQATNSSVTKISVLFSGNTNELQTQAGSTTYHGSLRKDLNFKSVAKYDADPAAGSAKDPLAAALQSAINGLPPANAGAGAATTLTIPGSFSNINVSGFASRIPVSYQSCATRADIQNLNFTVYRDPNGSVVRIQLLSFEMRCPGSAATGSYVLIK